MDNVLGNAWRNFVVHGEDFADRGSRSLAECFSGAGLLDEDSGAFWEALLDLLQQPATRRPDRWYFERPQRCLALSRYDRGWTVSLLRTQESLSTCPVDPCDPEGAEPSQGIVFEDDTAIGGSLPPGTPLQRAPR